VVGDEFQVSGVSALPSADWTIPSSHLPTDEVDMRFLSIVKSAEIQGHAPQALMDAMAKFTRDSLKDGSLIQTGGLSASATGARLRMSGGKLTVTNGPFTESKEIVGGYALFEAPSKPAAMEFARRFLQLHQEHWPTWESECELRELVFLAP
jgi:hypothetical protein